VNNQFTVPSSKTSFVLTDSFSKLTNKKIQNEIEMRRYLSDVTSMNLIMWIKSSSENWISNSLSKADK
jgi:hypothetical protein